MSRPVIEPVTTASLGEFAQFLHENLSREQSPAEWARRLATPWLADQPNHGFVLRDEGRIVGGIGAIYALRRIAGREERFCNITSWCVLDAYRQQSMRLAMAVIGQPGFHYTDFSPTKVVAGTLQFFKFRALDDRQAVLLNLPGIAAGSRVLCERRAIEEALDGEARRVYLDHADFPWLRQLLLGKPGDWCHIVYKPRRFKRLPAAGIIHVSDGAAFCRHFRALAGHFLARGLVTTHVECRRLPRLPWPAAVRTGFNPKMVLSSTLKDDDVDYLYSETVALDL